MKTDIHDQQLLIIDFGSQYTQLIARRVREVGVYCEILPFDHAPGRLTERARKAKGIILSGGPESVTEGSSPRIPDDLLMSGCPVLGICYGMQAMAAQLGGQVGASNRREFGHAAVEVVNGSRLLGALDFDAGNRLPVWMSHGDKVTVAPPGFCVTASTDSAPIAAMEHESRPWFGLQFHPEVTHTRQGDEIYRRFAVDLCGCDGLWTPGNIIADAVEKAGRLVGDEGVVLGLSGGVDSSVVAAILSRAIGDRLTCVFVDNGLLRKNERQEVEAAFAPSNALNLNLVTVDARAEFYARLAGVEEPEAKRKAIGNAFIDVFEREAKNLENVSWLAQGTIYPDVIESAAGAYGKAHVIKSHHNVGGLPERMSFKLIEPLRELFKGRGAQDRAASRVAARIGLSASVPRPRPWRTRARRDTARLLRHPARSRRHIYRGTQGRRLLRPGEPGVCSLFAGEIGRRGGGCAPVRARHCAACRGDGRFHDRPLGASALCTDRARLESHRQRDRRRFQGGLRCVQQAAGDHRVGVSGAIEAVDTQWMRQALDLARSAASRDEVPVGAVLVADAGDGGAIVGRGQQ